MRIKDALGNFALKMPKSFSGNLLRYEEMNVDEFKIDKQYQRHISPGYIRKGGALDLSKLTPIVVCKRPDSFDEESSGYYVVDGQHRTLRVINSDYRGPVPVVIMEHSEDATLEECVQTEAKLFHDLNSLGKKPTKMDEVRAGIYSKDPKALNTLNIMNLLNVSCDNFGSEKGDAREVEVFTHFYILCNQDYDSNHTSKILDGYNLLNTLYPKEITVKGDALRAMCLLYEFIEALTNGKKEKFSFYVYNVLPNIKTVKALTKGRATGQSPSFILHDIINMYNESPNAIKIGQALIDKLSNKDIGGNPRFKLPQSDS